MSPFITVAYQIALSRLQHTTALMLLLLLAACGSGSSGLSDPPAPTVAAPTIVVQPGNLVTDEGVATTFSVHASGSGTLTYQWFRNNVEVAGATLSSYTLSSPSASDTSSQWKVRVGNSGGSILSATVILTVNAISSGIPTINTPPQNQTVSAGTTVTFSVDATSTSALGYQWQRNDSDIPGATANSYVLSPAQASDNGSTWRVIVSNAAGAITSSRATLTVTAGAASAPVITTQPASQSVTPGNSATFSVVVTGSPAPTFQWQRDGIDIPGATASSHVLTPAQAADNGSLWRVIATNSAGTVTSNNATLTVLPPPPANTTVVTVLAGVLKQPGTADGAPGRFMLTVGMGIDAGGNIYAADIPSHTLRRISPAGHVTTLAGSATDPAGNTDGEGSLARLGAPAGIALDAGGNIYVSDILNHNIRKVTPSGTVTTVAGSTSGHEDDTVDDGISTARFKNPWGIAVDSSGNLYVADTGNNVIRKVTPAGLVTTLAGTTGVAGSIDGTGSQARFSSPTSLVVGADGNLYVLDRGSHTVRKVTPAGEVTTLAGHAGESGRIDGTGEAARFNGPNGLSVDGAGNLYVADTGNSLIRKITMAGVVSTIAGNAGSTSVTTGAGGSLNQPLGIVVSGGDLFTAGDSAILRLTP
jgi:sugar lactone lactonase YvrE